MFKNALVIALIMYLNTIMVKKSGVRPKKIREKPPHDSLRILASLITQHHLRKISKTNINTSSSDGNGRNDE